MQRRSFSREYDGLYNYVRGKKPEFPLPNIKWLYSREWSTCRPRNSGRVEKYWYAHEKVFAAQRDYIAAPALLPKDDVFYQT